MNANPKHTGPETAIVPVALCGVPPQSLPPLRVLPAHTRGRPRTLRPFTLRNSAANNLANISLPGIEQIILEHTGLNLETLHSRSRREHIVRARQVIFCLARELTPLTYCEIGGHFNLDHGTVMCGERAIRDTCSVYPAVAAEIEHLRRLCVQAMARE